MLQLSSKSLKVLSILGAFATLIYIYLHHFHNGFFIDDTYMIQDNVAIRSLRNIPAIFTDTHTESSLPIYQMLYRPFFIFSLAIDYYIAGGNNPVVIHAHTFIGFVVLIILCFLLNIKIFGKLVPAPFYPALLATCCFAFHPITADVVNYMYARTNIFSTLYGMIFMVTWIYIPFFKKYHLYLIPLVIGCLYKINAIMFVPLLWLYIIFFDYETGFNKEGFKALKSSFKSMLPSLITGLLTSMWILHKSIPGAEGEGVALGTHLLTQAHVILKYFLLFFMPENLNPAGQHPFINSILDYHFVTGFLFIITSFLIVYVFSLKKSTRAISYGLAWYFISLAPTSSFIPFAINYIEYYMFATVMGLSLVLASVVTLIAGRMKEQSRLVTPVMVVACLFFLTTLAYGSRDRVRVWSSFRAMQDDIIQKDPTNGHVLMNLGVCYMSDGKLDLARECFNRAEIYWPQYDLIYVNLGILSNITNDTIAADAYFQKGISLHNWNNYLACYWYASFLHSHHHDDQAVNYLATALQEYPNYPAASDLLKDIYSHNPNLNSASSGNTIVQKTPISANDYINLSIEYYKEEKYQKSIAACKRCLMLDPNSAVAYSNICAAYLGLKKWDSAIIAGSKAIKLQPDFTLAHNNLNYALAQKKAGK
jgi:tetratricopeptide (TPR) repeat protein